MTTQRPYSQIAYLFASHIVNSRGGISLADIAYVIDEAIDTAQQVQVSPKPAQIQCIRTISKLYREGLPENKVWNEAIDMAVCAIAKEM